MGMDSKKLSARLRQPGHDRTFVASERSFIKVAKAALEPKYEVFANPPELRRIFTDEAHAALGINPEASVTSPRTGRKFFVEVKKQGKAGNAEERAAKHHTVQFYKTLRSVYPDYSYHPYVTIFCDHLSWLPRYTIKFRYLFEPDQYFLWKDYDPDSLAAYLIGRCHAWLD